MQALMNEYQPLRRKIEKLIKTQRGRLGLQNLNTHKLLIVVSAIGTLHTNDINSFGFQEMLVPLSALVRTNCAVFHFIDELIAHEIAAATGDLEESDMLRFARSHLARYLSRECWRVAALKRPPTPTGGKYYCCVESRFDARINEELTDSVVPSRSLAHAA